MGTGLQIAVASSGLGHVARGIETWAAETARVLHQMGEAVTLFKGSGRRRAPYERLCPCLPRGSAANRALDRILPGPAWRLGLGSTYDIEQTTFALNLIPMVARAYDVVHTQDPLVALTLQRARGLGMVRAPVVLGHGTEEPLEWLRRIEFVQHLAPYDLEQARAAGCCREGWTAIGNFVDTEVFAPRDGVEARARRSLPPDSFVVLSVAALKSTHKRVDYLIREVAELRSRTAADVRLVVAGARTGETDRMMLLGRDLLGSAVLFLVSQPRDRMPVIYSVADVFALCSLREMMPIALLEAIASGLPSLVSAHPVVGWMIGPGGEQVAMEREGALAAALEKYLDPELRHSKGRAARRHAVGRFGKEVIVRQYVEMYRQVAARANGRAA